MMVDPTNAAFARIFIVVEKIWFAWFVGTLSIRSVGISISCTMTLRRYVRTAGEVEQCFHILLFLMSHHRVPRTLGGRCQRLRVKCFIVLLNWKDINPSWSILVHILTW